MVQAEIANKKSLVAAREQVSKITGGSIDYLINNAAYVDWVTMGKTMDEHEEETDVLEHALTESFNINVVGVIHTINTFLPLIQKGSAKKVVLISTGMADPNLVNQGIATDGPYSISKAAANLAICKYNAKFKKDGILFFSVSPGVVSTWKGEEPAVIGALRQGNPGWTGPITPLESAEACIKVTHSFTAEKNGGSFVSHHGDQNWL